MQQLPLANSTAEIPLAGSNPFKWLEVSDDLLYLGMKPVKQKQKKNSAEFAFSMGMFSVEKPS